MTAIDADFDCAASVANDKLFRVLVLIAVVVVGFSLRLDKSTVLRLECVCVCVYAVESAHVCNVCLLNDILQFRHSRPKKKP